MKIKKGDLIVVQEGPASKMRLMKARADCTKSEFPALLEVSKAESKRLTQTVALDTVVLNLGNRPPYGSVYGQKVEPLLYTEDLENWGELHCYRRINKEVKKIVLKALERVWKDVKKLGVESVFPIIIELRNKNGRWAGHHKLTEDGHIICLKMKDLDPGSVASTLRHELFHAIDCALVTDRYRIKWLKEYARYIKLTEARTQTIASLRKGLEKSGSIKDYRLELKEEDSKDLEVLDECLGHLRSVYAFEPREVNLLLANQISLKPYWPTHAFDLSDTEVSETLMTEYGMTKPCEFFAEAGLLYIEGRLGKSLKVLMEKTLSNLRT